MLKKYLEEKCIIELKGDSKEVYEDSWENGEGEHVNTLSADFLDSKLIVNVHELTGELIKNFVINSLSKNLFVDDTFFGSNSLTILDDFEEAYIIASTTEDSDSNVLTENIREFEEAGNQLYSCRYQFIVTINGTQLTSEDFKKLMGDIVYC